MTVSPSADPAAAAPSTSSRIRSIFGGSMGNLVEWYDWYVYSAFTLYFAPVFFPADDRTAQLLNAAAIFAVGFLMRPLGAWLMGRRVAADRGDARLRDDRCGRTGAAAARPAVARSFGRRRIWCKRDLFVRNGATRASLSEMAQREHRGFFSSFQYVTLIAGQLIALCVLLLLQTMLPDAALEQWGWRVPFAIGGVLAISVFYLRRGLLETQDFKNVEADATAPRSTGLQLFRHHPKQVLIVMALTAGGTLAFYAYSTYMQKFLVNSVGLARDTATGIMAAALFIYMLLQPVAGWLSDRVGRKPLLIGFGITGMTLTVPIFTRLETVASSFEAFLLVLGALVIVTGYTAINAVVKAELFPANIRTLGIALPYALANTIFGGTAEYVALAFKSAGLERGFYWYVSGMIAISLIVYLRMSETSEIVVDRRLKQSRKLIN